MRKRTRSREFALQVLYQIDLTRGPADEALRAFWEERKDVSLPADERSVIEESKRDEEVRQYTEVLVNGTLEKLSVLDALIERFAENWAIGRMAYVDRNILRLASYEMIFLDEIPLKVAINEAVELAKRYGEPDSSKFVNGILDKIAKTECSKK